MALPAAAAGPKARAAILIAGLGGKAAIKFAPVSIRRLPARLPATVDGAPNSSHSKLMKLRRRRCLPVPGNLDWLPLLPGQPVDKRLIFVLLHQHGREYFFAHRWLEYSPSVRVRHREL